MNGSSLTRKEAAPNGVVMNEGRMKAILEPGLRGDRNVQNAPAHVHFV